MSASPLDRRAWFALCGVVALSACKKREVSCPTGSLAEADASVRQALKYAERSTDPGKHCEDCLQYTPPGESGCGGCKVMAGPIHPQGTCVAFSKKG